MLKLYKGLSKYKGTIALMVLFLLLQVLSSLALPNFMSKIVDYGIANNDTAFIVRQGMVMLLITLIGSGSAIVVGYFSAKASVGLCCDIRKKLFKHVDKFTLNEFDKIGSSSMLTRTTSDVAQIQDYSLMLFRVMLLGPLMGLGAIGMAIVKQPEMVWIIYTMVPVLVVVVILIGKFAMPLFSKVQLMLDKLNVIMRESLTGVRVIRAFIGDKKEQERFENKNRELRDTTIKAQLIISSLMPAIMLILNLTNVLTIWLGAQFVASGAMQVGDVMAFLQYIVQILFAMVMVSLVYVMYPRAKVCAERINEVLEIQPCVTNPENPKTPTDGTGVVEFKNVSFSYPDAKKPAVSNISFIANPGKFTAIIGATGCGKSTIISLLPRLYDATLGEVLLDGVDVRNWDLTALRDYIAYMPQKALLFSGSIKSNIKFSNEAMSDERMEFAAEVSQSTSFVGEKAEGFDSPIAQGGKNVSGGQRQRLAIARALAKEKAKVIVFDDSFSALDFKTDSALRKAIKEKYAHSTVIIVAQRINTIVDADNIIVVNEGKIVGQGTHAQLVKSCPTYEQIAASQLS